MSIHAVVLVHIIVSAMYGAHGQLTIHPEQVHLSYGEHLGEVVVTWVTQNYTAPSVVEYTPHGTFPFKQRANTPEPTKFTDGGPAHRTIWIHRVVMSNLLPKQGYVYHVGGPLSWSNMFMFKTRPSGTDWSPKFVVYGDFGNSNAETLTSLQEEAQLGHFDAVLHIGDFAYDMNDNNGKVGDEFMRQIEPIAAYVPYMTCPGNHEAAYNFSHYKNRFTMPGGDPLNMVYSFDVGPVHFISISSEAYYSDENQTLANIIHQYQWLEADLQKANKASSRKTRPWIIALGHRPMYCSNQDGLYEHCNNRKNPMLIGTDPITRAWSLEDLFYKYGVDVHFYAHEHSYERLWPVYKWTVCNGSKSAYHNPTGPVHIITGSAGNSEGQTKFDKVVYPWSAFHSDDFGYTRLNIINATHIHLEQVSIDKGGKVVDKMVLVKEAHGAGLYTCQDSGPRLQNVVRTSPTFDKL